LLDMRPTRGRMAPNIRQCGQVLAAGPTPLAARNYSAGRRAILEANSRRSEPFLHETAMVSSRGIVQVRSSTVADGAFDLTDSMPFFIAASDEYIWLRPIVSAFAACNTKYGFPPVDVLCS